MANTELKKAEAELKGYLEKHPHLQIYQNRLDEELSNVPDEERFETVFLMTMKSFSNIFKEISTLNK